MIVFKDSGEAIDELSTNISIFQHDTLSTRNANNESL